jgi:hypothetical protein
MWFHFNIHTKFFLYTFVSQTYKHLIFLNGESTYILVHCLISPAVATSAHTSLHTHTHRQAKAGRSLGMDPILLATRVDEAPLGRGSEAMP